MGGVIYLRPDICIPRSAWFECAPGIWAKRVPETAEPHPMPWVGRELQELAEYQDAKQKNEAGVE